MMKDTTLDLSADLVLHRLDDLRKEMADLAFVLESGGRIDAADVANMIGARLTELHDELALNSAA
jgi:hypothetical protein